MAVLFCTPGTLPIRAVTTMGVSVKETDDPIGYFGTGLKYAIAVLLRCKHDVTIFTDGERFDFRTVTEKIRGKKFEVVCVDGSKSGTRELGFTTELGKNWQLWQAYRELYSNTLDENGVVQKQRIDLSAISPARNETMIAVQGSGFEKVHDEREHYFLETEPVVHGDLCEAHRGAGSGLYYRRIRVADNYRPALYNYNLLSYAELTEDRTLKYSFRGQWAVCSLIMSSEDEEFVEEVLTAPRGSFEESLNFAETNYDASKTFLDVVGRLRANSDERLNKTAAEVHRKARERYVLPRESCELTAVEQKQLDKAIAACTELGCNMDAYGLVVAETLGAHGLGRAENHTMYLSKKVFAMGTKMVAGTLYEEYVHLATGHGDFTREMQDFLIDKIMSMLEDKRGEPL